MESKPQVSNPSNFELLPLHITGILTFLVFSIYHNLTSHWDNGKVSGVLKVILNTQTQKIDLQITANH